MGTLTGRHTRNCHRTVQKHYRMQVYNRYTPIIGFEDRARHGFMSHVRRAAKQVSRLFEKETEVTRIFSSARRESGKSSGLQRSYEGHKYYFALNLYQSFDVIPDIFSNMLKVSAILGFHNIFISVFENGSTDRTKASLQLFDGICRAIGIRVVIRTDERARTPFAHRIEFLAEVRNAVLAPMYELREVEGEVFDTVIFLTDVLPCMDDLLELIWQSRVQNAAITCGTGYIMNTTSHQPMFYDSWTTRDMNGTAVQPAPFENVFLHPPSAERFMKHLPIQMHSCWNGIVIVDPAPMYMIPHILFRMADLPAGECSASELSLLSNDYWTVGYGRIVMVPRVKLAYSPAVYRLIHPERKNLTEIRGYFRVGGLEDHPLEDPQDRTWFGPHDRVFSPEESKEIDFKPPPPYVWCWGWEGAADLEEPDVEPIWDRVLTPYADPVKVRHDRSFEDL